MKIKIFLLIIERAKLVNKDSHFIPITHVGYVMLIMKSRKMHLFFVICQRYKRQRRISFVVYSKDIKMFLNKFLRLKNY